MWGFHLTINFHSPVNVFRIWTRMSSTRSVRQKDQGDILPGMRKLSAVSFRLSWSHKLVRPKFGTCSSHDLSETFKGNFYDQGLAPSCDSTPHWWASRIAQQARKRHQQHLVLGLGNPDPPQVACVWNAFLPPVASAVDVGTNSHHCHRPVSASQSAEAVRKMDSILCHPNDCDSNSILVCCFCCCCPECTDPREARTWLKRFSTRIAVPGTDSLVRRGRSLRGLGTSQP